MKKHFFFLLFALVASTGALFASYTEVDGIWYDFDISSKTATVTYRGYSYSNYSNEYSGEVVIPASVTYKDEEYSVTIIGRYAFRECSGLTSVTIPNSVTSIGDYAFCWCSGLTSITIPNSVTSIGEGAFSICSGLTSVTIPNSVTSIGSYAFYDCSGLTSVTIPNSVTSIGDHAFLNCTGLTSVTIGNSVTSIGDYAFRNCTGLTSVTIPNSVTCIGNGALYDCSGLTSVTIPNSVTSIGSSAFSGVFHIAYNGSATGSPWGATYINKYVEGWLIYEDSTKTAILKCINTVSGHVEIPNSVTSIGDYAFNGCSGLTSVIIPNSVTSIGDYAFNGCSGLTSMIIPNSVTSIGKNAFYGVPNINYSGSATGSPWGAKILNGYVDGYLVYEDASKTTLLVCFKAAKGEMVIPNSVTSIGSSAFYNCSGLTSVTIPNSVTSIGSSTFGGCNSLTSVTIPNSVTSIGDYAFNGCTGLTSVMIPESVTTIGIRAFSGCSSLTSVTIPNSVTSIGDYAFNGCTGLTSVTIGNSVTSIGGNAFYGCSGLASVTIGNSVTSIGKYAFSGCNVTSVTWNAKNCSRYDFGSQVESFTFGNEVEAIPDSICYKMDKINTLTIPNSVTSIGKYAFYDCSSFTSVTIPNSVTSIGDYAFCNCSKLEVVYISDLAAWCGIEFGDWYANPLYYAHNLRLNNKKLTNLEIPNGVTSIGDYAFNGCSGLSSVTIPNSVTSIGSSAFSGCSGLTSVMIPNSVTYIGSATFNGCSSLTSVIWNAKRTNGYPPISYDKYYYRNSPFYNIRNNIKNFTFGDEVEYIPAYLCYEMTNLDSIVIPTSVTSIQENAFYGCSNITSVVWNAKNCEGWNFGNQVESFTFGDEVEIIPASICSGMNKLTSVSIPNSVTSIGSDAFEDCRGLTSVSIPNSVTSIEYSAFDNCRGLTSVYISDLAAWCAISFANDDANPLYYAHYLYLNETLVTNLDIPNNITSIGDYAFNGCTGLTSLTIPNSVTSIGYDAFYACSNLEAVYINDIGSWCNIAMGNNSANPLYVSNTSDILYLGNSKFADLIIPDGITNIPNNRFYNCKSIISVTLPTSVSIPENDAFNGCTNLRRLTVSYPVPPTGWSKLNIDQANIDLYVPSESVETYASSFWWEDFASIRAIGSKFVVKFQDWDGTELLSQEVEEGKAATPPADPAREGYTFTGWDKDYSNITENLIITALYQINRLDVTFKDWDGTILKQQIVDWSTEATAPADPKREGYTFIGWDKDFSNIKEDIIVTAQYELGEKTNFIINFNAKDGENILHSEVVLTIPAAPVIEGFTFIGWRPVAELIETNVINIEAIYEADIPSSAPAVYTNPTNKAQKLIRENNVYILRGDKTYSITGQIVK